MFGLKKSTAKSAAFKLPADSPFVSVGGRVIRVSSIQAVDLPDSAGRITVYTSAGHVFSLDGAEAKALLASLATE